MLDYGRRFFIVLIIAFCIGLMFIGGKASKAAEMSANSIPADWIWPAEGAVSDHFGTRGGAHKGVDIAGSLHTDILAVSDGIISKSYYSDSYGHVVFIRHPEEGFETVYAHLHKRMVQEGESVKQGQLIGEMGNTGRSRGVHLHFEVHQHSWSAAKENAINPLLVIERSVSSKNRDNSSIEVTSKQKDHREGR